MSWAARDLYSPHLPLCRAGGQEGVSTKPVGQLLKDSARFATIVTPWVFVVLGILGKVEFSPPWEVVWRLVIAWVIAALVTIPFDIAIYALEGAQKRRKTGQKADRGTEA